MNAAQLDRLIKLGYIGYVDGEFKETVKGKAVREGIEAAAYKVHLTECWLANYPNDPGARCTCLDYEPD